MQAWAVHAGEHASQVHRAIHLVQIDLGQFELLQQIINQMTRAVVGHFQAHLVTIAQGKQLPFQGAGQIFHILVHFHVRVTGNPELVTAGGLHPREKIRDVGVNHGRQEHKIVVTALAYLVRNTNQTGQGAGSGNNGQAGRATKGILAVQRYDKVQALVDQPRERVRRVQRNWCEHWVDLFAEIFFDPFHLGFGPVFAAKKVYPFLTQSRQQDVIKDVVLAVHRVMGDTADFFQHFFGQHAVGSRLAGVGFQLVLQSGHTDFEKFIHVAGKNQQKVQPFHQGMAVVHGLFQHPQVELQQAQFPVEIVVRVVEVDGAVFAGNVIHWRRPDRAVCKDPIA